MQLTDDQRLDDPEWVASELCKRGLRVFVVGEQLDPDRDPLDLAIYLNVPRWFVLGGGAWGEAITADVVNRGRLIDASRREANHPESHQGGG